jgi:hypothetical protein
LKYGILLLVLSLIMVLSFISTVECSVVTNEINPTSDSMVRNSPGFQNTNFGSDQNIGVMNALGQQIRSYIYFDLSSIPTDAKIYAAALHFHLGSNLGGELLVGHVTSSWTESSITWNNQPTFTETGLKSQNTATLVTITSEVQSIVNGQQNNGWCLYSDSNQGAGFSGYLSSKDNSNPSYRPYLTVVYDTRTQAKIALSFTPTLINPSLGEKTTISGRLTNFAETSGIGSQNIVISWKSLLETNMEERGEISTTTDSNGYYSVKFPDSVIPNGEYHFQAVFEGNDEYTDAYSETIVAIPDGSTLFVLPEYAFGGLLALIASFAAVAVIFGSKKRVNLKMNY